MVTKEKKPVLRRVLRILTVLCAAFVLALGSVFAMVCLQEQNIPPAQGYGAIIVLGSRVNMDGTLGENLTFRMEAALASWQESPCLIICCGAQGSDEPAPEGEVMRQWLIDRGVPEDQVLAETGSYNTLQSIRNAAGMLEERGIDDAAMLTSAYHVPRAMAMAEDAGLDPQGIGCAYTTDDWLRHHARETLSWIKYWAQKYLHLPIA